MLKYTKSAQELREERRERARASLEALLPPGAMSERLLSEEELAVLAKIEPGNAALRVTMDLLRRRHLGVLMALYEWQPGQNTDALVDAAARVKELVDTGHALEDLVKQALERKQKDKE